MSAFYFMPQIGLFNLLDSKHRTMPFSLWPNSTADCFPALVGRESALPYFQSKLFKRV